MADPDEPCGVCGESRAEHGDKHHRFSVDGVLTPLKPGPEPRQSPPALRGDIIDAHTARLVLRLLDRLTAKGLLTSEDLSAIFGGPDASSTGGPVGSNANPVSEAKNTD